MVLHPVPPAKLGLYLIAAEKLNKMKCVKYNSGKVFIMFLVVAIQQVFITA